MSPDDKCRCVYAAGITIVFCAMLVRTSWRLARSREPLVRLSWSHEGDVTWQEVLHALIIAVSWPITVPAFVVGNVVRSVVWLCAWLMQRALKANRRV